MAAFNNSWLFAFFYFVNLRAIFFSMSRLRAHFLAAYLNQLQRSRSKKNAGPMQLSTLRWLLGKARGTAFGRKYGFQKILGADQLLTEFQRMVPVHTYAEMRDAWWHRTYNGEPSVTWPGFTPYFSMSSGTSDAVNKNLPVTSDLVNNVKRVGLLQMAGLSAFGVSRPTYGKEILMLGSTTNLVARNNYLEGDMSGISLLNRPWWLGSSIVKPGRHITKLRGWRERIAAITGDAHKWNIGAVCGVPSWVMLLFEEIIEHYRIRNIHELWPDFELYVHGGVAFGPYGQAFQSLLGKDVIRQETYMASEGSFGFQSRPGGGITLVPDAGVFFEFMPFSGATFDEHGNPRDGVPVLTLPEVQRDQPYALVITTCGGAWRYLIGDVVSFTDPAMNEISIVGRTRQFLDLCGEHVSVDNMVRVVEEIGRQLHLPVKEFAVAGSGSGFRCGHQWFVGCDVQADSAMMAEVIDRVLCALNDDYRVVRQGALDEVKVKVLPNEVFHSFLLRINRQGEMSKFPRVLSGETLKAWNEYLVQNATAEPVAANRRSA